MLYCVRAPEKSTWADEGRAGLSPPAVSVGYLGVTQACLCSVPEDASLEVLSRAAKCGN